MLYVQQSLGPNEEILLGARFHWIYTFKAVMWIVFGLMAGIAIAYAAVWWEVNQTIRELYDGLPENQYEQAEEYIVAKKGGYLKILWGLEPILRFSILAIFILGLFIFANMMIVKATTEIAITTDRLIHKRGMIARHVVELSMDRIEGVNVRQGVTGRILGYGRVTVRGMGVGEVILPPIAEPIEFRRAVQEAQSIDSNSNISSKPDSF